ncbi:MAG: glycosyltransferase [Rhodocyclales bacterium]|nr:glycosyltransferase [Rhodocyclales bacterium]
MNQPLVSIIIRSMDRPTLAEALASVSAQDYPAIQVVLVNATGAVHSVPAAVRADYSIKQVGGGQPLRRSAAANLGLDAADGEFVMFLDDDDRILPGHVSSLQRVLQAPQAADAVLAYAGVRCVDDAWQPTGREYRQPFNRARLYTGNYIPIHAALFRRSAQAGCCRFDESLDIYEDWDFWLQLMQRGRFVFLDEVSAEYRIGGQGHGFGVNFSEDAAAVARTIARRWLPLWNDEDRLDALAAAMERDGYKIGLDQAMRHVEDADRQLRSADTRLRESDARLGEYEALCRSYVERIELLEGEIAARDGEIAKMLQSKSWRVTAPLRWAATRLKQGS